MTLPSDLPPSALKYWGAIEGAVRDRLSTADIWSVIRDQAEAMGLASPGISATQVSRMRGMAAAIRGTGEAFARAQEPNGIDTRMIGTAPWARDLAQQNALPMYQIRFQHTTINASGEQETNWRTIMKRGALPQTVGGVHTLINQDAEQMADNYEQEHVGYGSVTILRV